MKKVVGYVARYEVQGPAQDKRYSDWRYSLMNEGSDTGAGSTMQLTDGDASAMTAGSRPAV